MSCLKHFIVSFSAVLFLSLIPVPQASGQPQEDLLSSQQRDWIEQQGGVFRIPADPFFRPYHFVNEEGELDGMSRDYLELLSARLSIEFRLVPFEKFSQILEAAENREVDIVPFLIDTAERRNFLNFTEPFYRVQDRIVMRSDSSDVSGIFDLAGLQVGIVDGYSQRDEITEQNGNFEVVLVSDELSGIRAVSVGDIDALIVDFGALSYYVEQEGITNLRVVGETGYADDQGFGIRNDFPQLLEIMEIGLASISEEEHSQISRRWINLGGLNPGVSDELLKLLLGVLIFGLLAALGIIIWVTSLRRQVALKTADLKDELFERKRIEAENFRLVTAVEQSAEYVLIIDKSGLVEYANLALHKIVGSENLIGLRFDELASEHDRPVLSSAFESMQTGSIWRGRVSLAITKAEDVHVSITISPIRGELETNGYVATCRDISHEEELEEKLRHGEKLKAIGTMAGGIAHDFNNLLVPILSYSHILRELDRPLDASERNRALDLISSAANRGQHLVQRILTFSRQETDANQEAMDLSTELKDNLGFLRSLLPSTIEIRTQIEADLKIQGERTQIQQILLNLGTNAGDAMENSGGLLEIELSRVCVTEEDNHRFPELATGTFCRLLIRDDGCGMDSVTKANMFDPYFTNKPSSKGTGLGLATVHGIVKSHAGAIRVKSSPGEGTQIDIFLPITEDSISPIATVFEPSMPRGQGERVLLVDDDELVLESVGNILDHLGYAVTLQSDPLQALDELHKQPEFFDILLTDYTMPNMNGSQLAQEVHSLLPQLPIIVMTGKTDLIGDIPFRSLGKPFEATQLAGCVQQVLRTALAARDTNNLVA